MTEKPILFVTRKLPPDMEARLMRDYRAVPNDDDAACDGDDLIDKSRDTGHEPRDRVA